MSWCRDERTEASVRLDVWYVSLSLKKSLKQTKKSMQLSTVCLVIDTSNSLVKRRVVKPSTTHGIVSTAVVHVYTWSTVQM
jgi:hypothetical protein